MNDPVMPRPEKTFPRKISDTDSNFIASTKTAFTPQAPTSYTGLGNPYYERSDRPIKERKALGRDLRSFIKEWNLDVAWCAKELDMPPYRLSNMIKHHHIPRGKTIIKKIEKLLSRPDLYFTSKGFRRSGEKKFTAVSESGVYPVKRAKRGKYKTRYDKGVPYKVKPEHVEYVKANLQKSNSVLMKKTGLSSGSIWRIKAGVYDGLIQGGKAKATMRAQGIRASKAKAIIEARQAPPPARVVDDTNPDRDILVPVVVVLAILNAVLLALSFSHLTH